ncbi:MAG: iron complex transport system ATP-binding protein [Acidimicrobiales bacterium]|jgi:iron complex transport system ATP-binding protein
MSPTVALEVSNIDIRYGPCTVLAGVSFEVQSGGWLGLIGPNGAGKSSLLKTIVGPTLGAHTATGEVRIGGRQLAGRSRARSIAYLPQDPMLPAGMTVAEYVLLGRSAHLSWLANEGEVDRMAARRAMTRLDLEAFADRDVSALSGGEAQRVCLAKALAQEAPLLLLDEPTSALDLGHQVAVLDLVDELRRELDLTVVAAMHDLTAAGRYADELLLLAEGKSLAHGPPENVLTEETLGAVYGADITMMTAPDGTLVVLPNRRAPAAP